MIEVRQLNKSYLKIQALKNLSFEVDKGEIYGIIAGKTTLFRILATLILADSGTATVNGFDVVKDYQQIRKYIGYTPP